MLNQCFKVAGAVIAFVGLVTLPEDINTWWGRLQDVGGMFESNPLAGGALAFGIILLAWGYRDELRRRVSGSKRWRSEKELEDELSTWLRDAGYSVEYQPTVPGVSFALTATSVDRPVGIVRPVGSPGILLQNVVKPGPPHDTVIGAMDDDQSSSLKEDLGIELARFGLGFNVEDILGQGIRLDYLLVITDTLTQYQFIDRVYFVGRAILLVQLILIKHVREAQRQGTAPVQLTPVPQSSPDTAEFPIVPAS